MIQIIKSGEHLVLQFTDGDLDPQHESQLAYWGFEFDTSGDRFVAPMESAVPLCSKVVTYLNHLHKSYTTDGNIADLLEQLEGAAAIVSSALLAGSRLKCGDYNKLEFDSFLAFLRQDLCRELKQHQVKAALHLLSVKNGANFSVPGSGKTTVVLAVFEWLRRIGRVDALFVVGPPACFNPWIHEFGEVLGRPPTHEVLAGGDVHDRHSKYVSTRDSLCDLYLTTFQTLERDKKYVHDLFSQQDSKFFLVIDEAHYVKQLDGVWANAALSVARHATFRAVLSGTPFPRAFSDAYNLFDILWPDFSPLPSESRHRMEYLIQKKKVAQAGEILDNKIGPLFYRVRKVDLQLAPQVFHSPVMLKMNRYERSIYESIRNRISEISETDYLRNFDVLTRLRRGRMIRLRQCLSYTALLDSAVDEYTEDLIGTDPSIADILRHYDDLETPAKLEYLKPFVQELMDRGEKVVIWSNFVRSLERIRDTLSAVQHRVGLIYGATPTQKSMLSDEWTRDEIIREFVHKESGLDILIANPAACAESVSLHKTCSHAVYYDLSYNCAQYVQSLDRIHRVGGSETKSAHYYFLQYEDSLDLDILKNVQIKSDRMNSIIDKEYPIYSMDMFSDDEELEAYDRIFGHR